MHRRVCQRCTLLYEHGEAAFHYQGYLVSHRGTITWDIASFVSTTGSGPVVGLIAVAVGALLVWRHRLGDGIVVVVATAAAGVPEVAVKGIVAQPAPE